MWHHPPVSVMKSYTTFICHIRWLWNYLYLLIFLLSFLEHIMNGCLFCQHCHVTFLGFLK